VREMCVSWSDTERRDASCSWSWIEEGKFWNKFCKSRISVEERGARVIRSVYLRFLDSTDRPPIQQWPSPVFQWNYSSVETWTPFKDELLIKERTRHESTKSEYQKDIEWTEAAPRAERVQWVKETWQESVWRTRRDGAQEEEEEDMEDDMKKMQIPSDLMGGAQQHHHHHRSQQVG
jgi:hypothetical protein